MRNLVTSASAAAIASIMATAPGLAQESGAGGPAMPGAASGGERAANEITCREIVAMDTATVPGVLYFISGHREGSAGAAGAGGPAQIGESGGTGAAPEMAASGGAAAGAEAGAASGEPATEAASAAETPSVGENSPALEQADQATAGNTAGAVTDAGGADAAGTPLQARDFEAVPDDAAGTETAGSAADTAAGQVPESSTPMQQADVAAAADSAAEITQADSSQATEDQEFEAAAGQGAGGDGQVMLTRVVGHFEIPVEQVMIACAETPDSPAADVVEQQRTPSDMTGGGAAQPESSN